jgi:hypothetical protein
MQQRMAHHTPPGLRPRQLPGLHSGPRIDVTGALECDRYFHLEALSFGYLLLLGRSTYTLLQRAFLFLLSVAISLRAYFRTSACAAINPRLPSLCLMAFVPPSFFQASPSGDPNVPEY